MGQDLILVVDDDPDNRAMIGHFLANWGYQVDDARNGVHALEKIKANPPSLVLLDLEMPEMDGFETCERLKTNPETEWIPVIIFTGLEKMPHRIRGFRYGADDYLVKTVEPDELRTRIDLVLKRSKRYASLASPGAASASENSPAAAEATEASGTEDAADAETSASAAAAPAAAPKLKKAPRTKQTAERPRPADGDAEPVLSVSLSKIPFPEAMRLVLAHGRNGTVELDNDNDGARGTIQVMDGNIVHADCEGETGDEAFYGLALWRKGRFDFRDGETGDEQTIDTPTRRLLTEASRRHDAWSTISSKVKSFDHVPKWMQLTTPSTPRLTKSDWALLKLTDGRRSIREIVDVLNTDIFEAGRVVYSLITVGVIELGAPGETEDDAFGLVPVRGDAGPAEEPFELTATEWKVLKSVDGRRNLADLREIVGGTPGAFMRVVKQLREKGFLRLTDQASKRAAS